MDFLYGISMFSQIMLPFLLRTLNILPRSENMISGFYLRGPNSQNVFSSMYFKVLKLELKKLELPYTPSWPQGGAAYQVTELTRLWRRAPPFRCSCDEVDVELLFPRP